MVMKVASLFVVILIPLLVSGQWDMDENDSVITINKPDSIFWVDDIIEFADSNKLFTWDIALHQDTNNIILLGNYERYAYAFINTKAYIAIKDNNRYRIWDFSPFVPEFTDIKLKGMVQLNNRDLLRASGIFFTSWSMMNPYAGSFEKEYETLILFDTEKNEVVFTKVFSNYERRVIDDDKFDRSKNEEGFELDSTDYEYKWFNYQYKIRNDKIEFYKVDENPTKYSEQEDIIRKYVTGKKPEFYYSYDDKNKKWVKKIPTH